MSEDKQMTLLFYDFVLDKDQIFFSAGSLNGLFQADLRTGSSRLLGTFPGEKVFGANLYCGTYLYKTYILFVPLFGSEFAVYNMEKGEIFKLQTGVAEEGQPEKIPSAKFYGSIMVGKNVYAFGWDLAEIVRIDMESFGIKKYTGWLDEVYRAGEMKHGPYFNKDVCIKGSSLFVAMGRFHAILELNMKTDKITIHVIGAENCSYKTLAYDGTYFWLTDQMKRIVRVDGTSWESQYKAIDTLSYVEYFNSSILVDQNVWLFANKADDIYRIDCQEFSVCRKAINYAEGDKWFPNIENYGASCIKKIGNNQLAVLTMQDCMLHILTGESDAYRVKFYADTASEIYYWDIWFGLEKREIIMERCGQLGFDRLRSFMHYIKKDTVNQQEAGDKKQVYGDKIYRYLG